MKTEEEPEGGMEQAAGGEDTRSTVLGGERSTVLEEKEWDRWVMGLPGQHQDQSEVVKARLHPTSPPQHTKRIGDKEKTEMP